MTDTPSPILLLRIQSTGSNTNLWGGYINTALEMLEQKSAGFQTLAVTGSATISWTNYTLANTGQCAHLDLTGTLAAPATLTFPSLQNWMSVYNNTGQTVTIMCSGGTGVAIPNLRRATVRCDGTDYRGDVSTWTSESTTLTNNGDLVSYAQMTAAIAAIATAQAGLVLNSATATVSNYLATLLATPSVTGLLTAAWTKINGGTSTEASQLTISDSPLRRRAFVLGGA